MQSTHSHTRLESGLAGAFFALVLGAVAMGISPIFVRIASGTGLPTDGVPPVPDVGPVTSAFWRVFLALPVLYAWMRIEDARSPLAPRRSFSRATILAGIAFSGDLFFWHFAILETTVANATFFATTAPIFVVLVVWLFLGQKIASSTVVGLLLCLLGGGALIGQSLQVDPARIRGDLFGVGTAVFFGLYFVAIERARETTGPARVTFECGVITAAILFVIALVLEPRILPQTWPGIAALVAMALISHAGGQGLLSIALGRLPAVFSSLVIFLEAVAAALFGWLILSEALTLVQALGGALILCGIWIARPKPEAPIG